MDKQMLLASAVSHIKRDGLHTIRRKNNSLPKVYLWDDDIDEDGNLVAAGQLRKAIDAILAYKKKQGQPSIYLFCNRQGQPYLPLENGRMFDEEGHAFGKPEGFNSIWQRRMAKWVDDGNERFTEHDIRKVPASATDTEHAQQLLDHHPGKNTKEVYQVGKKVVEIQRTPSDK